jgi:hypothetical protein
MDYSAIGKKIAAAGFLLRGGFYPGPGDAAPDGARTLLLVGNAGLDLWRAFGGATTAEERSAAGHPLDRWTKSVLGSIAADLAARAVFPFEGPPYPPFQRWALRAGGVFPSPIGPLIDPTFGLWHAYRGALLFADKLALPVAPKHKSPCDSCAEKPCLFACPVGAFRPADGGAIRYDVPACVGHLASDDGGDCMGGGCLARRACPVGRDFTYHPEQAGFHMRKFLVARWDRVAAAGNPGGPRRA